MTKSSGTRGLSTIGLICRKVLERLGHAGKEGLNHPLGVGAVQAVEFMRQGEDEMGMGHLQHFSQAALQPGVFGAGAALGAVPVAAGVVVPVLVAAGGAAQLLTTEQRRAAGADAPPRPLLRRAEFMAAQVGSAAKAQHLGQSRHGGLSGEAKGVSWRVAAVLVAVLVACVAAAVAGPSVRQAMRPASPAGHRPGAHGTVG